MAEISGGCFTISSLGSIGGTAFTPIINAPEVAILGVCPAIKRPVQAEVRIAWRRMLRLSLSYDHRVINGADAARFVRFLGAFTRIVTRDFSADPLPVLSDTTVAAMFTPPDQRTPELDAAIARSDALVDELVAADVILLDTPMFNWSTPASLKAWIDNVVRPGRTFLPGANYKPLLADRPTYVVIASGGVYERAGRAHHDFLTPYLRHVLGWMGLKDLRFVRAEGGLVSEAAALGEAREALAALEFAPVVKPIVAA